MIEVRDLSKTFASRRHRVEALRGVSFTCRPGEVFGLLGRNGAGKTTTLRVLATVLAPTGGTASVMGHDVVTAADAVRRSIGFLTGDTRLYDRLSAREALEYFGRLQGMSEREIPTRVAELAERYQLGETLERKIGTFSTGQKQRVSLARAMMHDPPVLILDEPTAGLDILAVRETLGLITALKEEGRVVLFSTHILSEVERICDRVAIIDDGRLLACDTPAALMATDGGDLESVFVRLVTGDPA
jgi:sodium transport system ATP-binding protein